MFKSIIRTFAFFRKEWVEIIRQPKMLLSLILGPFLILLLFGIGYRNEPRAVQTLFVVETGSPAISSQIRQYATSLGEQIIFRGITPDESTALQQLKRGDVDMVVVIPSDSDKKIQSSEQVTFTIYHNEIDPAQADYIAYLGRIYIDEVNRRVLGRYAEEAQTESYQITDDVAVARQNAQEMRAALQAGNTQAARLRQADLTRAVGSAAGSVEERLLFGALVASEVGQEGTDGDQNSLLQTALDRLKAIQEENSGSNTVQDGQDNFNEEIERLDHTEQDLAEMEEKLNQFQSISPSVLIRPFGVETQSIAPVTFEAATFFTPAVIALILQHLAVTFGALSIIRERLTGSMDLFRVSPISAGETLFGKYVSYMTLGTIMAAVLSLLLFYVLKAPILGGWLNYSIVVLALLFYSLGLGFVISLLADTESQAVQLAMISLLISVFFSGLFLDLRYLWKPVQIISWLTPATYGTQLLKDVMLRGMNVGLIYIVGLIALGLLLYLIALRILRREMRLG